MAEIAERVGSNGLTVVSTFSGCGGSCLGFEMAGYRVLWASEFVEAARNVYALNHPGVILDGRDIRDVKPEDILSAIGKQQGEVDVLEGSPPCASFSTAGKRHKAWGQVKKYSDTEQRSDDLFFEYVRILDGVRPRVFVAENVSGLVKGAAYGYFELIMRAMRRCGYRVRAKVLDAQWLGVPQERKRVIFVGVREDLEIDPQFPKPLPYRYTIREALPWISGLHWDSGGMFGEREYDVDREPVQTIMNGRGGGSQTRFRVVHDTSGKWGKGDVTDRPAPTITVGVNGLNSHHFKVVPEEERVSPRGDTEPRVEFRGPGCFRDGENASVDAPSPAVMAHGLGGVREYQALIRAPQPVASVTLEGTAIGRAYAKLEPGKWHHKYKQLQRPIVDKPCPTLTAIGGGRGVASVVHPNEPRKFLIAELKRLCGFPDDFELTGAYTQQWERLGRSVPPVMMSHVATTLRDQIFGGGR